MNEKLRENIIQIVDYAIKPSDTPVMFTLDLQLLLDSLETLISSHYIAKEKVKGLKIKEVHDLAVGDLDFDERIAGKNSIIREINKAVDDLLEPTPTQDKEVRG